MNKIENQIMPKESVPPDKKKMNLPELLDQKVYKQNNLIEAYYKLGLNEQKIVLTYIAMLKPTDSELVEKELSVADISTILQLRPSDVRKQLFDIARNIIKKPLTAKEINAETGKMESFIVAAWFTTFVFKNDVLKMKGNEELRPYLLKLKQTYELGFTSYKLKEIVSLQSTYAIRLYELLLQYKKVGSRTFLLSDLKKILEAEHYKLFGDFKRRVLDKAQDEINKKTNIIIIFTAIKKGRAVHTIKFTIKSGFKEQQIILPEKIKQAAEQENELAELLEFIPEDRRDDAHDIATKIFQKQGADGLKTAIEFCNAAVALKGEAISSYGAYMRSTCYKNKHHLKQKIKAEEDTDKAFNLAQAKAKAAAATMAKQEADSEALKIKEKDGIEKIEMINELTDDQLALLDRFIGKQELNKVSRQMFNKGKLTALRVQFVRDFKENLEEGDC